MNVTELARKLRINTVELLEVLPQYGFDIGRKAIKIDDVTAEQVVRRWKYIKRELEEKKKLELEEKKTKEKELRKELGQDVTLGDKLTVREFAEKLNMTVTQIITELMKNGILANQNQNLDFDTMSIMSEELGFTVHKEDGNIEDEKKEELTAQGILKQLQDEKIQKEGGIAKRDKNRRATMMLAVFILRSCSFFEGDRV